MLLEYVKANKVLADLSQQEQEVIFDKHAWSRGSKAVNILVRLEVVVASAQVSHGPGL